MSDSDSAVRILLVEDNEGDARLVRERLGSDVLQFELRPARSLAEAAEWLAAEEYDVVLLDLSLPESDGLDTMHRMRCLAPELPIVVLSGYEDEALSAEVVKAGAQDYLLKGLVQGNALRNALRYALARSRAEERVKEAEKRYRSLFEEAPVMYVITRCEDGESTISDCNHLFLDVLGYGRQDVIGHPLSEFYADPDVGEKEEARRLQARDGRIVDTLCRSVPEVDPGGTSRGARVTYLDVSERRRAKRALQESEATNRAMVEAIPDLMLRIRKDGTFVDMKAPRDFTPISTEAETVGKTSFELLPPALAEASMQAMSRALETGACEVLEYSLDQENQSRHYEARLVPFGTEEVVAIVRDITGRKELEEQFRQSQKMDAVGRLAGGVAHDFNNMLTAIGGYAELLLMDLSLEDPRHADVAEIKKSSDRAADLTRQLLAFSRRQVLQLRILDLNRVVSDLMKLLRRLIPEDIELKTSFDPSLRFVKADPAQIEQILMNLAVNSRDAMPAGGTITFETKEVQIDDAYRDARPKVAPGRYVMLAVSDTGQGIAKDIQPRIFEPFFTTKEPGGGTGLGLSTVYGIVKQSEGWIWVYSEVGLGTTFKIYLPRVDVTDSAQLADDEGELDLVTRPSRESPETILLVEDDDAVRALARRVLREQGYRVIEAGDGAAGLSLCEHHGESVDLMITDVVMPGVNGPQMVEELHRHWPQMKFLYMSGYTENSRVREMLTSEAPFLQKPFSAKGLVRTVRQVLDA